MTQPPQPVACANHPDRAAGAVCTRCARPICPECMIEAPVGWQCPDCVKAGAKSSPVINYRPSTGGPLGATRPTPMVIALIVVNVLCFVASGFGRTSVIDRLGILPQDIQSQHQWYRFVTAMFLHVSVEHIALNMITLLIIGPAVEVVLGKWRFLAVYVLAGLGGAVASYLLSPIAIAGVGASGAIFGVIGAYLVLAIRKHFALQQVIALIVLNVLFGFVDSQIDWRAHLGGFLIGGAVTYGLLWATDLRTSRARILGSLVTFGLIIVALVALAALVPPGHVNWT